MSKSEKLALIRINRAMPLGHKYTSESTELGRMFHLWKQDRLIWSGNRLSGLESAVQNAAKNGGL